MKNDQILSPDETPIFWRFDKERQDAIIRIAERMRRAIAYERGLKTKERRRTALIAGINIGLAPLEHHDEQHTKVEDEGSPICGTAQITKILRRFVN